MEQGSNSGERQGEGNHRHRIGRGLGRAAATYGPPTELPRVAATVLVFAEAQTPEPLRRQVRAAQEEVWPSVDAARAASLDPVHDPQLRPLSMLLVDGDTVLSALDLLFRPITHAGMTVVACGLSAVVTPAARRGRGFGRELVSYARTAIPELGADLGLFTCDRALAPFYESGGWELLPGTVLVGGTPQDPFPSDGPGLDKVSLGAFFTPLGVAARPALVGSRIPLHCGTIDRLW